MSAHIREGKREIMQQKSGQEMRTGRYITYEEKANWRRK
jgi:hypothetical protein